MVHHRAGSTTVPTPRELCREICHIHVMTPLIVFFVSFLFPLRLSRPHTPGLKKCNPSLPCPPARQRACQETVSHFRDSTVTPWKYPNTHSGCCRLAGRRVRITTTRQRRQIDSCVLRAADQVTHSRRELLLHESVCIPSKSSLVPRQTSEKPSPWH